MFVSAVCIVRSWIASLVSTQLAAGRRHRVDERKGILWRAACQARSMINGTTEHLHTETRQTWPLLRRADIDTPAICYWSDVEGSHNAVSCMQLILCVHDTTVSHLPVSYTRQRRVMARQCAAQLPRCLAFDMAAMNLAAGPKSTSQTAATIEPSLTRLCSVYPLSNELLDLRAQTCGEA